MTPYLHSTHLATLTQESTRTARRRNCSLKVTRFLEGVKEPRTTKQIIAAFEATGDGEAAKWVSNALWAAENRGRIKRVGVGVYQIKS